jgi:hypothetical protein
MITQLAFGGVGAMNICSNCHKPLSNPVSVQAGMGPVCRGRRKGQRRDTGMDDICNRSDFSDGPIYEDILLAKALAMRREEDGPVHVLTNVPHLVVHHSPNGFEFGYGGSGPADLALNVCQFYLITTGYQGEKSRCFDGQCFSLAWVLHQDFKRAFIESAPYEGATVPFEDICRWFEAHITGEMKQMYATIDAELDD